MTIIPTFRRLVTGNLYASPELSALFWTWRGHMPWAHASR